MKDDFKDLVSDFLKETGAQLGHDAQALALYANERAAYLATLIGQPGFQMAVRAERDNVVLRAAISATVNADAVDARFVGLIQGALALGAKALA